MPLRKHLFAVALLLAVPAGVLAQSGTLRFGTNQQLDDWETLTKATSTYLSLIFEGLVELFQIQACLIAQGSSIFEGAPAADVIGLREVVFSSQGDGTD